MVVKCLMHFLLVAFTCHKIRNDKRALWLSQVCFCSCYVLQTLFFVFGVLNTTSFFGLYGYKKPWLTVFWLVYCCIFSVLLAWFFITHRTHRSRVHILVTGKMLRLIGYSALSAVLLEPITEDPVLDSKTTYHALNESCAVVLKCSSATHSNVTYKWAVGNHTYRGSGLQHTIGPQDGGTTFTCTASDFVSEKSASKTVTCSSKDTDKGMLIDCL